MLSFTSLSRSRLGVVVVALFALLAPPASHGQTHPTDPDAALADLAWLVGVWEGDAPMPDGGRAVDRFTFEWAPNKKAFRYAMERSDGGATTPLLVGLCAWHPTEQRLALWEVSGDGALTESTLVVEGNELSYEEKIHAPGEAPLPVRAQARRDGPDSFHFEASVEKEKEWKVVFQRTWRRAAR